MNEYSLAKVQLIDSFRLVFCKDRHKKQIKQKFGEKNIYDMGTNIPRPSMYVPQKGNIKEGLGGLAGRSGRTCREAWADKKRASFRN